MLNARINFPICTRTTDAFMCNFLPRVLYAHELQEVGVHYPKPVKRICNLNYTYKDSQGLREIGSISVVLSRFCIESSTFHLARTICVLMINFGITFILGFESLFI